VTSNILIYFLGVAIIVLGLVTVSLVQDSHPLPSWHPAAFSRDPRIVCDDLKTVGSTAEEFREWLSPREVGELADLLSCIWERTNQSGGLTTPYSVR